METLIIHIKEKKDVITIKSLLSKMKSVALIEDSYTSFEQGTYKVGEKPSDFVTPDPDIDRTKVLQEFQETRKKAWKLK